ncbi:MAG TPA: DUF5668 domain-containing protein, partial [Patescibacteria group bacterium]|nr:DUF5668 domain-containing protein [Patescibacteria group bacterium]
NCPHHKMFPIFVVLFGLTFLLGTLEVLSARTVSIVWPIIVILIGLQKLMGHNCKCCSAM